MSLSDQSSQKSGGSLRVGRGILAQFDKFGPNENMNVDPTANKLLSLYPCFDTQFVIFARFV
jgi:hypothetical protein